MSTYSPVNCSNQSQMIIEGLHLPLLIRRKKKQGSNQKRKRIFFNQQSKQVQDKMASSLLTLEQFETDTEENQRNYDEQVVNYGQFVRNKVQV